jgi:DNA ligase-1
MEHRKPTLACDADLSKIRFPAIVMPKIDGVRGCNFREQLTGRSLKAHANLHVTKQFSKPNFLGFDGEFAAEKETHPDLCRITTSALSTISGNPYVLWHIFDYITEETKNFSYIYRLDALTHLYNNMKSTREFEHIRLVPYHICHTLEDVIWYDNWFLEQGYEGTIIRDPNGLAKQGRSTVREGIFLRIKRFIEEEAIVISITEGEENLNEATKNELGRSSRSSHQENKVPNGLVGSLQCKMLKDVYDVQDKTKLLLRKDDLITVSPGNLDHTARKYYFDFQDEIIGETIKFKFFPKGIKDKPRFPTFVCIRPASDR